MSRPDGETKLLTATRLLELLQAERKRTAELEAALRDVLTLWEEREQNFQRSDDSLAYAMMHRAREALQQK
jgi:hypothetical protein